MNKVKIAVVGATGLVGSKLLQILEERKFPIEMISLLASPRSAGKKLWFRGQEHSVQPFNPESGKGFDIAFFAAGAAVSREYAGILVRSGVLVIDKSSAWRMDPQVPLVVPEVNREEIFGHHGIIAVPNCSTTQMVMVLKPLHDYFGIKRVVVTTYQSVSGSGKRGVAQLQEELKGKKSDSPFYPFPIAQNIIPQIDSFLSDGYTKEEEKMVLESQKILKDPSIRITATTVRVPVVVGHSESINIEFEKDFEIDSIRKRLKEFPGVVVQDDPKNLIYPMPLPATDTDAVYVGRIRRDPTLKSGLNLWVVSDNLRKGAATNAVQIAEEWLKGKIL